jgi:hypothetical protein
MTLIPSSSMLLTALPFGLLVFLGLWTLRRRRRAASTAAGSNPDQAEVAQPDQMTEEVRKGRGAADTVLSLFLYAVPITLSLMISISGHQVVIVGASAEAFADRYRLFETGGLATALGSLMGVAEPAPGDLIEFVEREGVPGYQQALLVNRSDSDAHFVWFAYMLPEAQQDEARVLEVSMQQNESLAAFAPGEITLIDRKTKLHIGCGDRPPPEENINDAVVFVGWLTEVFVEECPTFLEGS